MNMKLRIESVSTLPKNRYDWINLSTSKRSEVHPAHFDHNQSKLWPWKHLGYPQHRFDTEKGAHHVECRGREAMC